MKKTAQENEIWISAELVKGSYGGESSIDVIAYSGGSPVAVLRVEENGALVSLSISNVRVDDSAMSPTEIEGEIDKVAQRFEQVGQALRKLRAEWKPTYDKYLLDNPEIQTQANKQTSIRKLSSGWNSTKLPGMIFPKRDQLLDAIKNQESLA